MKTPELFCSCGTFGRKARARERKREKKARRQLATSVRQNRRGLQKSFRSRFASRLSLSSKPAFAAGAAGAVSAAAGTVSAAAGAAAAGAVRAAAGAAGGSLPPHPSAIAGAGGGLCRQTHSLPPVHGYLSKTVCFPRFFRKKAPASPATKKKKRKKTKKKKESPPSFKRDNARRDRWDSAQSARQRRSFSFYDLRDGKRVANFRATTTTTATKTTATTRAIPRRPPPPFAALPAAAGGLVWKCSRGTESGISSVGSISSI